MYKLLSMILAITVLATGSQSTIAAQGAILIGDKPLILPVPKGFVSVQPSSAQFAEGEQWTVPTNRLLALYVPEAPEKGSQNQIINRVAVQSYRKGEYGTISPEEFKAVKKNFLAINQALIASATKYADKFQPTDPELAALGKSVRVGESKVLSIFNESSEWSVSTLMLIKYTKEVNGQAVEFPTVLGSTIFFLRGKLCFLYVYHALDSTHSLELVKTQSLEWLASAKKNNP